VRDILDDAVRWLADGRDIAVATVVAVRGSAPRELGASLVVAADGALRGMSRAGASRER
jgi:xanthine dehydrogenase accessory factor